MKLARLSAGTLVAGLLLGMANMAVAQDNITNKTGAANDAVSVDLQTQLEKGLKARRKSEFAFIADVVQKVEDGELSRKTVDSTFQWARKRYSKNRFQYFQKALQIQAKKLGVDV